ncbi:hypothetical protein OnM2_058069 [Erysiphe neolycopersici]|uniref:Uncharacterized protein n=1 Tax=Erysiphe neolycopersici TaxID=212602 RepID=A0A420HQC9_9PEZI|nr:hypothetical protein OnM2_058069 [Erysiphe neolycopersici]
MSHITVKSPQKPTQIFDAKTICRDCSVGDPTFLPSQIETTHDNEKLNKALRSSSTRSEPLFNRLTAILSVLKQSSTSDDPKNRRDSPPMSLHKGFSSKLSQLDEDVESKIICPQKTLPLKHKSEVTFTESIESNLPTNKKSKELTKSPKIKTGSFPCFELTPLSHLIQQSFRDIERLQQVHATQMSNCPEDPNKNQGDLNLLCGLPSKYEEGKEVDFNRVKENLKRFEDLYMKFLNQEGDECEKKEEVHLVAVVCKRSQVISGLYKAPIRSLET